MCVGCVRYVRTSAGDALSICMRGWVCVWLRSLRAALNTCPLLDFLLKDIFNASLPVYPHQRLFLSIASTSRPALFFSCRCRSCTIRRSPCCNTSIANVAPPCCTCTACYTWRRASYACNCSAIASTNCSRALFCECV